MQPRWKHFLRTVVARIPSRAPWVVAREIVTRANAERDARRFEIASALYEEALRIAPDSGGFHVQYGHMYKEQGNLDAAEQHYLKAADLLPRNADLALQFGHLYKLAGREEEAAEAYSRALSLRPGWAEARDELTRLGSLTATAGQQNAATALLPELLAGPTVAAEPRTYRLGYHVTRLGAARLHVRGGYRRALRGGEAVRGFVIDPMGLREIAVLLDGRELGRGALQPHQLPGGQTKFVFNLWIDFGTVAPGSYTIELKATDGLGLSRFYRKLVEVVAPVREVDLPDCDAVVDIDRTSPVSLDHQIERRPSTVRKAGRRIASPRTILVQRADQLGDLVCSVPAIERLRLHFPEARLIGLVTAANVELARSLGLFEDLITVDFREEPASGRKVLDAAGQRALADALSGFACDIAIDLGETSVSRPLLLLSGAPILCGFKDNEFPWLTLGFQLNSHDPVNHNEMTAHEQKLVALVDAVAAMLGGAASRTTPLPAPPFPRHTSIEPGARYAVLHTGARLAFSRWPGFAELAERILAETDLEIVWMGEAPPASLAGSPRLHVMTGLMPFETFDGLIAHCALFVGNDSGPKHLAALRGAPAISLHMARLNWNEWGQTGNGLIVSRRVPCAGCGVSSEPEECGRDFTCIRGITAAEVFASARTLLVRDKQPVSFEGAARP